MSALASAAGLVVFPIAAGAVGSAAAALHRPGPALTSAVQHLAAGVVFAAVAGEVLPELRHEGRLPWAAAGFAGGVALLLALGAWSRRIDAAEQRASRTGQRSLPIGLLAAVAIDLFIDGLLVGLGATLGSTQAVVLTIALTLEILFLGVSVCAQLLDIGIPRRRAAVISALLGIATAAGALGGALVLGDANPSLLAAVLAFGAAALLYLVVEELLVEAHEQSETAVLSAMFFLGFLGLYILAEVGG